jgi:hypothetical protein
MAVNRSLGRLAIAAGIVAIAADASFGVFSAVGEPFGHINDFGNAAFGILAGWIAWSLRERAGQPWAGVALAGAAVSVVGSWLVLSGTTGWLLAGFVSGVGFALIGPSVVAVSRSMAVDDRWPRRLTGLGIATGILMVIGIASLGPVALRYDNPDAVPGWAWIGFVGWLGAFLLYPVWAIWLGRVASR